MDTDHGVDPEILLGQMRCFEALGEWGQLHDISCSNWSKVSLIKNMKNRIVTFFFRVVKFRLVVKCWTFFT